MRKSPAVMTPFVHELVPAPDPLRTCERLAGWPFRLWLDSAIRSPRLGRYSFLTADPVHVVRCRGRRLAQAASSGAETVERDGDLLAVVREWLDPWRTAPAAPPWNGGRPATGEPLQHEAPVVADVTIEPSRRGVYCGSIGYWSLTGGMDTSIAIRTAVAREGRVSFSAGGGIVADSDPALEYAETLHKARGIIEVLASADA